MLLSEIDTPGIKVRIVKIYRHLKRHRKRGCMMGELCGECALVRSLSNLGFTPGTVMEIKEVNIFGSPIIVKLIGASYAICDKVAEHIEVEIIDGDRNENAVQRS